MELKSFPCTGNRLHFCFSQRAQTCSCLYNEWIMIFYLLVYFFFFFVSFQDISKSLVLTEMGFKKDAEQFQTMMANIRNILSIPVHG